MALNQIKAPAIAAAGESEPQDPDFHPVRFPRRAVEMETRPDGTILLRSPLPLGPIERNIAAHVRKWAAERPETTFLAERGADGQWVHLSYAEAWRRISSVGEFLAAGGHVGGGPLAILSPNSIAHAVVAFGAMAVGVAVAPLSPQFSRIEGGLERLLYLGEQLQPSLVFVERREGYESSLALDPYRRADLISGLAGDAPLSLPDILAVPAGDAFERAYAAVEPDAIAKIIFTSGSTGSPKGVKNSHRNMCVGARSVSQAWPWDEEDYVLVDWLPWSHSLGGTNNVDSVLQQGGTMYIDGGRPLPGEFETTVRNLIDIAPSFVMNVPAAFQMLAEEMEVNQTLRDRFFSRLRYCAFSGAALPQETWDRFQALSVQATGKKTALLSGWGCTEAAPGISVAHWFGDGKAEVGLPLPGFDLKLVPFDDRYEARVRGPGITPGYIGAPEASRDAFDEEGYYKVGDALRFLDPERPELGLIFAGRASENFKLVNGSFVNVGALRLAILSATDPLLRDVVVAGENRKDIRLLAWVNPVGCRARFPDIGGDYHAHPAVAAAVRERIADYNAGNGTGTRRVAALHLLAEPASLGAGETTDKGYINQRKVLQIRAALVDQLYDPDGTVPVTIL
ncbi:hypothetical protein A0J57_18920 [Sphingobium sp. 22B]|nr:AMP-binding protein [Sphingobium sp. 22B]KXU30510.1 hypothetical protein AXW74_17525 [Sphingobium sp. AM]KYC30769.1 hypothetical protein A0J57_18920 [Sphingobium sp. 22B]